MESCSIRVEVVTIFCLGKREFVLVIMLGSEIIKSGTR